MDDKRRVLILFSTETDISSLNSSPLFAEYEFDCIYVSTHFLGKATKNEKTQKFLSALEKRVHEFHPDIMIIHLGYICRDYPIEILTAVNIIQKKFSYIQIGFDYGIHHFEKYLRNVGSDDEIINDFKSSYLLEPSAELRILINKIF